MRHLSQRSTPAVAGRRQHSSSTSLVSSSGPKRRWSSAWSASERVSSGTRGWIHECAECWAASMLRIASVSSAMARAQLNAGSSRRCSWLTTSTPSSSPRRWAFASQTRGSSRWQRSAGPSRPTMCWWWAMTEAPTWKVRCSPECRRSWLQAMPPAGRRASRTSLSSNSGWASKQRTASFLRAMLRQQPENHGVAVAGDRVDIAGRRPRQRPLPEVPLQLCVHGQAHPSRARCCRNCR